MLSFESESPADVFLGEGAVNLFPVEPAGLVTKVAAPQEAKLPAVSSFVAGRLDAAASLLTTAADRLRTPPQVVPAARPRPAVVPVRTVRSSAPPSAAALLRLRSGAFKAVAATLGVVLAVLLVGPPLMTRPLVSRRSRLLAHEFVGLREAIVPNSPGPLPYSPIARAADLRDIQRVLNRYRDAFSVLDVSAVKEIWPAADAATLAQDFRGLAAQNYDYNGCRIVTDGTRADAYCLGIAEYRPVGRSRMRTDPREWQFTLLKGRQNWRINTAVTRPESIALNSAR